MTPDLKELERLARAATPGPWTYDGDTWELSAPSRKGKVEIASIETGWREPMESEQQANIAYILAANPAAILSLIAELARVRAVEPFGWYSAKEDDFMLDKIRKTHERLNSHTHRIGKYDTALFTAPQPAAQEPTSAVPVVEQLVLAATAVIDYDESDPDDGVTMMLNYADALAKCRDAIAAGQKFIKENGK